MTFVQQTMKRKQFFLLKDDLNDKNNPRFKNIERLWGFPGDQLSVDQSFALRVDLLQCRGHYQNNINS